MVQEDEAVTAVAAAKQYLQDYHPILIEGPGLSDKRDAKVVAQIVLYNIKRHFQKKPRSNEKPLLLITQGDPIAQNGISAISRIVANDLKVHRCLIYLDEKIDPDHYKNADKDNVKFDIKFSEIEAMMMEKEESKRDYDRIRDNVMEKMSKYESKDWVQKYALLQELTKATLKTICGCVTVVHTVAVPKIYSVTRFFSVGVDLGIIDKETDMVKYSCELFDLLEEKRFDEVSDFLSPSILTNSSVKKANVLFVDGEYANTSVHLAAFLQAPTRIFEQLFEIGGADLHLEAQNKWESTALIDACHQKNPDVETITYLLKRAKEIFPTDEICLSFVRHQNTSGFNALHACCFKNNPKPFGSDIIKVLVKNGGIQLCMVEDKQGRTPLGLLYSNQDENIDDIEYLSKKWYNFDPSFSTVPFSILHSAKETNYGISKDVFLQKYMNKIYTTRVYIFIVMCDFYAAVVMLYCLSFGLTGLITNNDQNGTIMINGVIVLIALSLQWMIVRETIQLWTTPFGEYISNATNYVDVAQILSAVITIAIIFRHEEGPLNQVAQNHALMFASALAWLRLIFVTGQLNYEISVFSAALVKVRFSFSYHVLLDWSLYI